MRFLYSFLFAIREVFSFPVNAVIRLWNHPQRGRSLIFALPAIVTLLFVLLTLAWTRYGLNRDLTRSYQNAVKSNIDAIEKMMGALNARAGGTPTGGDPELREPEGVGGDVSPGETGRGEESPGNEPAAGRPNSEFGRPGEAESPAEVARRELGRSIVRMLVPQLTSAEKTELEEPAWAEVRVAFQSGGSIATTEILRSSGDDDWNTRVHQAVRDAQASFENIREQLPDALTLRFDRNAMQVERLRTEQQIYLRKLIELNPADQTYKYELARLLSAESVSEGAVALMSQIAPIDRPGLSDAHVWMAEYIWKNRRSTEPLSSRLRRAEAHLRLAVKADPMSIEANAGLGDLLMLQSRVQEAVPFLERVFDQSSKELALSVTETLFRAYTQSNEIPKRDAMISEVEQRLRRLRAAKPENQTYLFDLEMVLLLQARFSDAAELLQQNVTDANRERVNRHLSLIYTRWASVIGRTSASLDEAQYLEKLKQAMEHDPTNVELLVLLTKLGNAEIPVAAQARQLYDPVAQRDAAPAAVLREYAGALIVQGKSDEAIQWLEEAHERNPRDPIAANNLAYLLLHRDPPESERALKLTDEALAQLGPQSDPSVLSSLFDTKAAALLRLGRPADAIPFLEAALRARPNKISILEALRDCYEATGQTMFADRYKQRLEALRKALPPGEGGR